MNLSINTLIEKSESRFMLCALIGKRARELGDGANPLTTVTSYSNVIVAINEVNEDKIHYTQSLNPNNKKK